MRHPDIENPNSKISKFFQLRFRVPNLLFKHYLVPKCESLNIFGIKHVVNSKCPIELKIMCCLRILGRGLVYDDILEMSQIPLSTIPYYLHTFCENITALLYETVIKNPANEGLQSRMDHYSALGLPGAMGSVDCTRVLWNRCPSKLRNFAVGKEKFPALSFLVVCDHNRHVCYVSNRAYLGGMNDINISNMDPLMISLRGGAFKEVSFYLILSDGTRLKCYGTYFISDNGFFESFYLMDPPKNRNTQNQVLWSEWIESTRKDIEFFLHV